MFLAYKEEALPICALAACSSPHLVQVLTVFDEDELDQTTVLLTQ